MAGRIDDIDLGAHVIQGDVLGEDRDSSFPFQIVGIQDAVLLHLRLAELTAGFDQAIDECRLAVIDVSDNCNVADVRPSGVHGDSFTGLPRRKQT